MAYLRGPKSDLQIKKNNEILPMLTLPPISKRSITEKCPSPTKLTNTFVKISPKKIYKRTTLVPKQITPTFSLHTSPKQNSPTFSIRTSITHPLNISWITPVEDLVISSNCKLGKNNIISI